MAVVDRDGRTVERYEYTPYGQRTVYSHGWHVADATRDGAVDLLDLNDITHADHWGKNASKDEEWDDDLNGDGTVDLTDINLLSPHFGVVDRQFTDDPMVSYPALMSFRGAGGYAQQGEPLCEFGHQGLVHDETTGLIYNRARMLHSTLGRFMQRDPLGYYDGPSHYQYVGSQPIRYHDPIGLLKGEGGSAVIIQCRRTGDDPKSTSKGRLAGRLGGGHCSLIAACGSQGKFMRIELSKSTIYKDPDEALNGIFKDSRWQSFEVERTNDYKDTEDGECCWFKCLKELAPKLRAVAPEYKAAGPNSNTYINVLLERCGFRMKPIKLRYTLWIDRGMAIDENREYTHPVEHDVLVRDGEASNWHSGNLGQHWSAIGWGSTAPWVGVGPNHPAGEAPEE